VTAEHCGGLADRQEVLVNLHFVDLVEGAVVAGFDFAPAAFHDAPRAAEKIVDRRQAHNHPILPPGFIARA
jgi:hypothetical protein